MNNSSKKQNSSGGEKCTGRIVKGIAGVYTVADGAGKKHRLYARGRFRKDGITPMVGDMVEFSTRRGERGYIHEILQRKNQLKRPAVANIDQVIIVLAGNPQPDLLLCDKIMMMAHREDIDVALCINKADDGNNLFDTISAEYKNAGCGIFKTSVITQEGIERIKPIFYDKISCFAGQSGTGKSSLLNALFGLQLATGDISQKTLRGRHTTRHIELLALPGGMVLDTPGFNLLDDEEIDDPQLLSADVNEFNNFSADCRFRSCAHIDEPDCAVKAAVESGGINAQRYNRYKIIYTDMKQKWDGRYD